MVTLIRSDLEFILAQIKISEAHAAGAPLTSLIPNTELGWGVRTVDGRYNNLLPGQQNFGAADTLFPRATHPFYLNDGDGDSFDTNGPAPGGLVTNNNYGLLGQNVADADPRTISNLIVDQTPNNPAAVLAALKFAGSANPWADLATFTTAFKLTVSTTAASNGADAAAASALAALNAAIAAGEPPEVIAPLQAASDTAAANAATAQAAEVAAAGAFTTLNENLGITIENGTLVIPNVAADEGLSAPFNSWMTLFGQFFDHGLDLVAKGNAGSVYMPLQPDDPLYVPGSRTNFMVIDRVSLTGAEATNRTTSWVDQNQTYTSHASAQVFHREYALDANGKPVATGRLLNGAEGGLATWADVKAQARNLLGIELDDMDILNIPLLATDQYGKFIPDPVTGFAQIVVAAGPPPVLQSGTPALPVDATLALKTGHAFLDDIAHNAKPGTVFDPDGPAGPLPEQVVAADADNVAGNAIAVDFRGRKTAYDDELLNSHFITGDGRGNENIGLIAVHHVFHSEHNRMVEQIKGIVLASNDPTFIAEWLLPGANQADGVQALEWNGERLFQAARIPTEMQYQHLVFEEFARMVQPMVDVFNDYNAAINPSILAEFAHVVYRFGHSMLNETVDRYDPNFNVVGDADPTTAGAQHIGLIAAFLNPLEFVASGADADAAAGAIIRGMTRQRGNEIDEFVTEALRNNLVGLPLDLAAINIARGRETGVPTLNAARREFFAGSGDSQVRPYTSWADFALYLKNEASIINFIAAYGTHSLITGETTLEGKRAAAMAIVFGTSQTLADGRVIAPAADSVAFLNSTGTWSNLAGGITISGLDAVDLWIGGLAEKKMIFGGMLGSTFNFVFENQMEALQNGDRFYYLSRLANTNLNAQLENNKFAELISRNSDALHLPGNVFTTPDYFLEVNQTRQFNLGLGSADPTGGGILNPLVIRGPGSIHFTGAEHVVLGGTDGNDTITGGLGDDTIWGDAGNDRLEGGEGVDFIFGGDGDDVITDLFLDDEIRSGAGNDVVNGGPGLDLIITDTGKDYVFGGEDDHEVLAGQDDDFVTGGEGVDFIIGGEGHDWLEGGGANNLMLGDNGDLIQGLPIKIGVLGLNGGNDVMVSGGGNEDFDAEGGDDIMVGGLGTDRFFGQQGFDWATHKNDPYGINADMEIRVFAPPPLPGSPGAILDRYATVEGLSGSAFADILRGDNETVFTDNELININLINGLQAFLGAGVPSFAAGNIIFGGDGSDLIEGRGGNDLIDGDRWLNVRISVRANADGTGAEIMTFDRMTDALSNMLLTRTLNPGQLQIVREIIVADGTNDVDTALFSDIRANYIIEGQNGVVVAADVDGDGFITITHSIAGVIGSDGIDRLKNIERLAFANVTLNIGPSTNDLPVGLATISDATPTEDQLLTVSLAGVLDPDNTATGGVITGPIGVFWQVELNPGDGIFTDIELELAGEIVPATGLTFAPGDNEVGLRLRARVIYQDQEGVIETVFSAPTAAVANINDLPVGIVAISDMTPTEGQTLFAANNLTDADSGLPAGTLPVTYQWQQLIGAIWTPIVGAAASSFTPNQTHVGRQIRVVATYVDGQGTTEVVPSAATDIVGDLILGTGAGATHTGTAGADFIDGQGGSDTLNGLAGNDTLLGGAGLDTLNGGLGADLMEGGTGNDTFIVDNAGDVVVELVGEGTDLVNTSLASYTLGANVERLAFTGVGNFNGVGNAGANSIVGGAGNDTLDGGGGVDTLVGGAGNDTYIVSATTATITETTTGGTDTVLASGASFTLDANVENLTYTGSGTFAGTGNAGANTITGGALNDTLNGGGANDILFGGGGADTLNGDGGNDTITGGAGDDIMAGGAGADTFVFASGFGNDRITGFGTTVGLAQDLIDLRGMGVTAANFAARVTISDIGADALITLDTGETITLVGVNNIATVTLAGGDFLVG
jgi:Ca2+-binding RTX toxin-like protein